MRRAELSPFVDYPRLGAWYPFAWAAWAAALVGVLHVHLDSVPLQLLVVLSPTLTALAFLSWYARRHGALPRDRRLTPHPLARLARLLWAGQLAVLVAAFAADVAVGPALSAPLAALGAGLVVAWYEHRYAAVADRLRREVEA